MANQKSIMTCLVQDEPGVLERVVSLIRRRGFNIASLAVGSSERSGFSRMTIIVETEDAEQVRKQLLKLINVLEVINFSECPDSSLIGRELALIKVNADMANRGEIIQIVNIFRGNIIDVAPDSFVVEITGEEGKINAFARLMEGFGVKTIMRSGLLVLPRGTNGKVKTWSK